MAYRGMMIGGPRAGQMITGEQITITILEAALVEPKNWGDPISATMDAVKRHVYVWRPLPFGREDHYAWVHDSLANDAAAIVRELLAGYHPEWVAKLP